MKHQKRSHPSNPKNNKKKEDPNSSEEIPSNFLKKSNLNISAGRVIYERARSRRQRHGLILSNSTNAETATPLGKSGKRGPGRAADLPHEYYSDKKSRIYEDDEDKVQELINAGRASATAFTRNNMMLHSSRLKYPKSQPAKKKMVSKFRGNKVLSNSKRRGSLSKKLNKSEKKLNEFLY